MNRETQKHFVKRVNEIANSKKFKVTDKYQLKWDAIVEPENLYRVALKNSKRVREELISSLMNLSEVHWGRFMESALKSAWCMSKEETPATYLKLAEEQKQKREILKSARDAEYAAISKKAQNLIDQAIFDKDAADLMAKLEAFAKED